MNTEDIIFSISTEWIQFESELILNRRLTDDEFSLVKENIEHQLLYDIDVVFREAISYAINPI
jgi:hypothetical protein